MREQAVFKHISYDAKAGITVFLIAIPLCLGISLASGVPPVSGIISGIIGGLVIGFLSGSNLSVSGPAAGLVSVVITALAVLGSFQLFLTAIMIAGVIQIIFGYARAGVIAHYIPYSVIKGMLAAIGLILIFKQIPHALAHDHLYEGSLDFFQKDGSNTITEFISMFKHFSLGPVIISFASFFGLYLFSRPILKKFKFFQIVPSALLIVIIAAVINILLKRYFPSIALAKDELVNIPTFSFDQFNQFFTFSHFQGFENILVYKYAFIIAIIGSIETLLSVEAADKLDPKKNVTPTSRELKAQGVGNILSGFFGGLPITSVIVRTSVNIENKAKTRFSTIIHGLLLLLSLFFAASLINTIPLAVLAVLLISVGYKLVNERLIKEMFQKGANQFIPFMVTLLCVFFTDILLGVLCGLIISIFFILRNYYTMQNFDLKHDESTLKYTFTFSSYTTFLSKAGIQQALNKIPKASEVILDFSRAIIIDAEIREMINDFKEKAHLSHIDVKLIKATED